LIDGLDAVIKLCLSLRLTVENKQLIGFRTVC